MKVFSSLTLFLLSTLVSADFGVSAGFFGSGQKVVTNDGGSVPGDNPLTYCEDPTQAEHLLKIKNVDLDPNPPAA